MISAARVAFWRLAAAVVLISIAPPPAVAAEAIIPPVHNHSCDGTLGWVWKSTGNDSAASYRRFQTSSTAACCSACEQDKAEGCTAWMLAPVPGHKHPQTCTLRKGPVQPIKSAGYESGTTTGQKPPSPPPPAPRPPGKPMPVGPPLRLPSLDASAYPPYRSVFVRGECDANDVDYATPKARINTNVR